MFILPMLMPLIFGMARMGQAKQKPSQKPATPGVPSSTTPHVMESEAAIRKRLAQTGRGTTIFTGGLFDNPTSRKERLIPV